jgi:hypothetical protein
MKPKIAKPSSSYQATLPEDICEQSEEQVSSYWLDGKPLLFQLSGYVREKGQQVNSMGLSIT